MFRPVITSNLDRLIAPRPGVKVLEYPVEYSESPLAWPARATLWHICLGLIGRRVACCCCITLHAVCMMSVARCMVHADGCISHAVGCMLCCLSNDVGCAPPVGDLAAPSPGMALGRAGMALGRTGMALGRTGMALGRPRVGILPLPFPLLSAQVVDYGFFKLWMDCARKGAFRFQ
jgi:hypothetical protein